MDDCKVAVQALRRAERIITPIHYHLSNHDILAAMAELRQGTNPSVRDALGRTALDLALELVHHEIQNALSTSIPVDFLAQSLERRLLFPHETPFIAKYNDFYNNMNKQPNFFRYNGYTPDIHQKGINKYVPLQFPCDCASAQSTTPDLKVLEGDSALKFPLPHTRKEENPNSNLRCVPTQSELLQRDVLIVVENALSLPFPKFVNERMAKMLRRIKSHLFLIENLAACSALRRLSQASFEKSYQEITFPYLYIATMKLIFSMYTKDPNKKVTLHNSWKQSHSSYKLGAYEWDQRSIVDARRLVNVIVNKKLPGVEIFRFMSEAARLLSRFISLGDIFVASIQTCDQSLFKMFTPNPELAQYLMHMAFVLDASELFEMVAKAQPNVFTSGDFFKWDDLLYTLTQV
ncbi:hypothetical protein IE077_003322 [Cardiosporidium cionae]|uniref:Uncharacterized protein n=1 Tax=Cardiosporidium cionae TaxID=476202 RepID=A0ABQ7J421_9APIC|nr:hypothetical protein IE077_003322 [Cardiosporidium cionae]|eukprot:KAF8817867.1 hypothetical protein IE077_003322 [Cardiosporidium cionae]